MSNNWDSPNFNMDYVGNRAATSENCGDFHHNEVIKAKVEKYVSLDDFCFTFGRYLTDSDYEQMMAVREIKLSGTRGLTYSARIYTTDLGQLKIYFDIRAKRVFRAKILDLNPHSHNGCISVRAKVLLIDIPKIKWVYFIDLYDFPHQARTFMKLRPESYRCRIHLSKYLTPESRLALKNERITDLLKRNIDGNNLNIKIIDFKNEIYDVDLLCDDGKSITNLISLECGDLIDYAIRPCPSVKVNDGVPNENYGFFTPIDFQPYHKTQKKQEKETKYFSAIHYFRHKLEFSLKFQQHPDIKNKIFRVMVLYWDDPQNLTLIPVDDEFSGYHHFRKTLDSHLSKSFNEVDPGAERRVFKVGQQCIYRNTADTNLYQWSRGIVIDTPAYTKLTDKILELSNKKKVNMVYKIRSIDYGNTVFRQNTQMRILTNHTAFNRIFPFSLRVKLFGVYPLANSKNGEYNKSCCNGIDVWIRDRIAEYESTGYSNFYALFRNHSETLYNKKCKMGEIHGEVTLFHRLEEYRRTLDDVFQKIKKKPPFKCLNTHLIEKGFASDVNPKSKKSSRVQLDEYLVNLLNSKRLI